MKSFDVLIVGLGPAGASAAFKAAEAGLSVIAVEKNRVIGQPVQCAEFIPMPMQRYAKSETVYQQTVTGMNTFLPSGRVEQTPFPGLMIDRAAFDQQLAKKAKDEGAELHCSTRLHALNSEEKIATLKGDDGEYQVAYRFLVAADGPHSVTATLLGLNELATVYTRQYTVPLLKPFQDTDVWISDDFPGGYAWLFPKGEVANLGLGIDKNISDDLKTPLDSLHQKLVEQGRVGAEILTRTGGAIPVGGLRKQLVVDGVLFTGDAAGLTHPITGAGISAAVISGERAGEAVAAFLLADDKGALADYEEDVRDQFETTLVRATTRRESLKQYWHTASAMEDCIMKQGWIAFDEYFSD